MIIFEIGQIGKDLELSWTLTTMTSDTFEWQFSHFLVHSYLGRLGEGIKG